MFKWTMLAFYLMTIAYILWRGVHCMKNMPGFISRKFTIFVAIVLFVMLCSTLLLGGLLPDSTLSISFHKFSNYWLGLHIYLLFFVVLADIVVLIMGRIHKWRPIKLFYYPERFIGIFVIIIAFTVGFTVYGAIHAKYIYVNDYDIEIEKDAGELKDLNVILVSDFHLGYSIGCPHMEQMVEKINALHPDLVVVAGDILDNDYNALDDPERLAQILSGIESKYGVYATYGNHDVAEVLIGGFSITAKSMAIRDPREEAFLQDCGFIVLEDEMELIDDSFYLIGRLDGEKAGDGTNNRMSIEELTRDIDHTKPCIVIAHEPDELQENADCGVDLLLNGHTHAGQFFPLTLSQPLVWKNTWGYLSVDKMHDFVSSGIGVYGPNLRVGTDSEIMQIRVKFHS